jgi:hypothetical protein
MWVKGKKATLPTGVLGPRVSYDRQAPVEPPEQLFRLGGVSAEKEVATCTASASGASNLTVILIVTRQRGVSSIENASETRRSSV